MGCCTLNKELEENVNVVGALKVDVEDWCHHSLAIYKAESSITI